MYPIKGFKAYKHHWEDQAGFMDKSLFDKDKIFKLTFSNDFDENIKELQWSNQSLKREWEIHIQNKVLYNYIQINYFEFKYLNYWNSRRNE